MIFLVTVLAATSLSLSIANPVVVLSSRQIPNIQCIDPSVILPTRCSDAINEYIRMVANITNQGNLTPAEALSRLSGLLQSTLGVLCSSECLDPYIRCIGNSSEQVRNLITQINCVRAEDGNYCPAKVLEEQAQRPGVVLIPSDCRAVSSTTCSSSCQQTYRQLRDDLGCCAATFFANPSSSLFSLGRNFATCNVTLGNPCSGATCNVTLGNPCSGAATIYFHLVLALAMVLVAFAMVWSLHAVVCAHAQCV